MMYKRSALILAVSVLAGCVSMTESSSGMNETFVTNITEDGTKLFNYHVQPIMKERPELSGSGEEPLKSWIAPWDRIDHQIYTMLDNMVAMTGYCREGYIELSSDFSGSAYQIHGECYEAVSAEDRIWFSAC